MNIYVYEAETLNPGTAEGAALALAEPLSFWGGFDSATGRIIDRWHPQAGACLAGRILLLAAGRGSSSGSSVLAEAIRAGTAPAGLILLARDPILTVGAMVAQELYGIPCPVVLAAGADWPDLLAAPRLAIEAGPGGGRIRRLPPLPGS